MDAAKTIIVHSVDVEVGSRALGQYMFTKKKEKLVSSLKPRSLKPMYSL